MTVVSKRLNEEMNRLGMDQTEFCAHLEMPQGPFSRWLNDKYVPDKHNWFTMAFELDIPFAEAVLLHKKAKEEKGQKTTTDYEKILKTGNYETYVPQLRLDRKKIPTTHPGDKLWSMKKGAGQRTHYRDTILTFPIRGYAAGGPDGRLIVDDTPISREPWPPELVGIKDAYGVVVSGDSMGDRYRHGFRLNVNPKTSNIRAGDGVVFQVKDRSTGDLYGYIKEFVKKTATQLVVRQFNPPKELRFSLKDVADIHKVVGTLEP